MANKYDKPVIDENKLGTNTYIERLKIPVYRNGGNDAYKQYGDVWLKADIELEATQYTKVFCDSGRRLLMVKLKDRAKSLLLWLIYEADRNQQWIWINKKRYMEENKISAFNTYKGAIDELMGADYIRKTSGPKDVYWLNPDIFFNGNRLIQFPNNIIKK